MWRQTLSPVELVITGGNFPQTESLRMNLSYSALNRKTNVQASFFTGIWGGCMFVCLIS